MGSLSTSKSCVGMPFPTRQLKGTRNNNKTRVLFFFVLGRANSAKKTFMKLPVVSSCRFLDALKYQDVWIVHAG